MVLQVIIKVTSQVDSWNQESGNCHSLHFPAHCCPGPSPDLAFRMVILCLTHKAIIQPLHLSSPPVPHPLFILHTPLYTSELLVVSWLSTLWTLHMLFPQYDSSFL